MHGACTMVCALDLREVGKAHMIFTTAQCMHLHPIAHCPPPLSPTLDVLVLSNLLTLSQLFWLVSYGPSVGDTDQPAKMHECDHDQRREGREDRLGLIHLGTQEGHVLNIMHAHITCALTSCAHIMHAGIMFSSSMLTSCAHIKQACSYHVLSHALQQARADEVCETSHRHSVTAHCSSSGGQRCFGVLLFLSLMLGPTIYSWS